MTNHPNRSKEKSTAANPTPEQVKAAREAAGLTQPAAAALVYSSTNAWQKWEDAGESGRRMHPAIFELFLIKTGQPHDNQKSE